MGSRLSARSSGQTQPCGQWAELRILDSGFTERARRRSLVQLSPDVDRGHGEESEKLIDARDFVARLPGEDLALDQLRHGELFQPTTCWLSLLTPMYRLLHCSTRSVVVHDLDEHDRRDRRCLMHLHCCSWTAIGDDRNSRSAPRSIAVMARRSQRVIGPTSRVSHLLGILA